MKYIIIFLTLQVLLINTVHSATFVETITPLSARDALAVVDDTIYASNYNNGSVFRVEQDGSTSTIIQPSQRGPAGIRFDNEGNMYVAMYNINSVIKLDNQGNESVFASGVNTPIALEWDSNQNLYVSSFSGSNTVTRIDQSGVQTPVGGVSQLSSISSLTLDASGDIFITSYTSGDIYKMTPSGSVSLFTSTSSSGLSFIQYDANENVFFATVTGSSLLQISADGIVETVINSTEPGVKNGPVETASIQSAIGLAISPDGKQVYFATNNHIRRLVFADPSVDQVRPYFTNDSSVSVEEGSGLDFQFVFVDPNSDPLALTLENLPSWVMFDGTDKISGTPSSTEAGQAFDVSAKLNDGFATVSANLRVSVTALATPPPPVSQPTPTAPIPTSQGSSGGSFSIGGLLFLVMLLILPFRNRY